MCHNYCIFDCFTKPPKLYEVMAIRKDMQMNFNLSSLLLQEESVEIKRIRVDCEVKVANFIATSEASSPFSKGKRGRDLLAELLIPAHITEKWQSGELRALK